MSLLPEATEALEYLAQLRRDQEKVLLSGAFNRISEYKAACAVLRNLDRQATEITTIFKRRETREEAGSGMTDMPEDDRNPRTKV